MPVLGIIQKWRQKNLTKIPATVTTHNFVFTLNNCNCRSRLIVGLMLRESIPQQQMDLSLIFKSSRLIEWIDSDSSVKIISLVFILRGIVLPRLRCPQCQDQTTKPWKIQFCLSRHEPPLGNFEKPNDQKKFMQTRQRLISQGFRSLTFPSNHEEKKCPTQKTFEALPSSSALTVKIQSHFYQHLSAIRFICLLIEMLWLHIKSQFLNYT